MLSIGVDAHKRLHVAVALDEAGLTDETPLAHMAMLARGGRIYDGPDEVHRQVVARRILKTFADGGGWHFH